MMALVHSLAPQRIAMFGIDLSTLELFDESSGDECAIDAFHVRILADSSTFSSNGGDDDARNFAALSESLKAEGSGGGGSGSFKKVSLQQADDFWTAPQALADSAYDLIHVDVGKTTCLRTTLQKKRSRRQTSSRLLRH
jgi:hypothetical protein